MQLTRFRVGGIYTDGNEIIKIETIEFGKVTYSWLTSPLYTASQQERNMGIVFEKFKLKYNINDYFHLVAIGPKR
jgi:hypothetical protein